MSRQTSDRDTLRAEMWRRWGELERDQARGVARPAFEKPAPVGATRIDLVPPSAFTVGAMPLIQLIAQRRSRRRFTAEPLTLEELSFLLWATQGVQQEVTDGHLLRTVPSAGARHPFETYLVIERVHGIEPGLYRYLSLSHQLCHLGAMESLEGYAQSGFWVGRAALTVVWTVIPYRTEWRYGELSPKLIALDAGHVCQNLYLACEAIGCGTCAIGAYDQQTMDTLIGVDGTDEFTIYVAPVGRIVPTKEA